MGGQGTESSSHSWTCSLNLHKMACFQVQKDRLPANLHMLHNCLNALIDLVRKSDEGKVFALLWTPDEYDILKLYETINPALCCDVCDEIKFSI